MKKLGLPNFLFASMMMVIAACSSGPQYEKMRTADDALNKYDQNVVKDGMAITKKGAVVDIKVEEVQAEKNRLQAEANEKDKKIEALQDKIQTLQADLTQLRLYVGLPPSKPNSDAKCCTSDGRMIPGKPVPTLTQELSSLKRKRAVNTAAESQTSEDTTYEDTASEEN